jgi:hypothetical protein
LTTRWCAAIGAAHLLWRDGPLEDIHAGVGRPGGIGDAEMMLGNVITSWHVAGALCGDGCDWRRLATELTDADRPIGEVVLSDFVGASNVAELRRHALGGAERLEALAVNGWEWLRTFLACSGSMREWFGVPWWPEHVGVFVSQVTNPGGRLRRRLGSDAVGLAEPPPGLAQIAAGLVTAPQRLPAEVLAWCVYDAGLGVVDRVEVRRRWRAAGGARWAPAGSGSSARSDREKGGGGRLWLEMPSRPASSRKRSGSRPAPECPSGRAATAASSLASTRRC